MWEKDLVCKYCQHSFHTTDLDVTYADLRMPFFFIPDYQYYVVCPMCDGQLIQTNIPSDIAVEIQNRTNESNNKTESTDSE